MSFLLKFATQFSSQSFLHEAVSSKQLKETHVDMVANVRLLDQRGSTPQAIGSTTPPGGCHLRSFLLPSPPSDAKRTDKAHKFCPSRHPWGTELPLTSLPSEDFTAPKWATSFDIVEALEGCPPVAAKMFIRNHQEKCHEHVQIEVKLKASTRLRQVSPFTSQFASV